MDPRGAIPIGCAALIAATSPALAQTRQQSEVLYSEIETGRAFQEQFGYNDAIVLPDGTIYLSGVVAGLAPGSTDLEAAYEAAYQRLGRILERAGASWDDVVDITSFHTDLTSQLEVMATVQKRYIAEPFPAWTAIQVARLVPDRGITEIKIVAKKPAE